MKRSPIVRKVFPVKRSRIRSRSLKMQERYVDRRVLVAGLLDGRLCVVCGVRVADQVHEVLSRGRGGDILDYDNCIAVCAECHRWITDNPKEAEQQGFLKSTFNHSE